MTGDAAPIAPEAPKASKPGSRRGRQAQAPVPAAQSASEANATPVLVPAVAPEMLPPTLPAVALELERDPDLAHRVAQALQTGQTASDADDSAPPSASSGVPAESGEGARNVLSGGEKATTSRAFMPQL